jgi:hypothetical protein
MKEMKRILTSLKRMNITLSNKMVRLLPKFKFRILIYKSITIIITKAMKMSVLTVFPT